MRHLIFLLMTIADAIGLVSMVFLAVSYVRLRNRKILLMLFYLLAVSVQLVFLTYLEYRYINLPNWHFNYDRYAVFNGVLQGLSILLLPLLVNAVCHRPVRSWVIPTFSALFLAAMLLIVIPYGAGMMRNAAPVWELWSYKLYLGILSTAFIYASAIALRYAGAISDKAKRRFLFFSVGILGVIEVQLIDPFFATFPETVAVFAGCYLLWNLIFISCAFRKTVRPQNLNVLASPSMDELDDEDGLTPREKEILALLLEGHTNPEIGKRLFISLATVKVHIQNIYRKYGVRNRIQLFNRLRLSEKLR